MYLGFFLLVSCNSKESKMIDFVKLYNEQKNQYGNSIFTSSNAYVKDNNTIEIVYDTDKEAFDSYGNIIKEIIPRYMSGFLQSIPQSDELIKQGVNIEIKLVANDGKLLLFKVFDLSEIKKLGNLNEDAKNPYTFPNEEFGNKHTPENLKKMLNLINRSLPVVSSETGITTTKIKINNNNELVYYSIIPDSIVSKFSDKQFLDDLQKEIIADPENYKFLHMCEKYKLKSLRYIYMDKNLKTISENDLTPEDLKNSF